MIEFKSMQDILLSHVWSQQTTKRVNALISTENSHTWSVIANKLHKRPYTRFEILLNSWPILLGLITFTKSMHRSLDPTTINSTKIQIKKRAKGHLFILKHHIYACAHWLWGFQQAQNFKFKLQPLIFVVFLKNFQGCRLCIHFSQNPSPLLKKIPNCMSGLIKLHIKFHKSVILNT